MMNYTWEQIITMLENTHTICIREICENLKCSRSWASRYVIPYLDKLYLDTGYRGNKKVKMSWTQIAAIHMKNDKYIKNSVWCNREQFEELIKIHAVSATKQTKRVPYEMFVKNKIEFAKELNEIKTGIMNKKGELQGNFSWTKLKELTELQKKINKIKDACLTKTGKIILKDGAINITQRNKTDSVPVLLPQVPIEEWRALHDEKDYGDTDESILRRFFMWGYVRVEICIPDPKYIENPATIFDTRKEEDITEKNFSKKIYYIADPEELKHEYIDEYVTIAESTWQQWREKLLKKL